MIICSRFWRIPITGMNITFYRSDSASMGDVYTVFSDAYTGRDNRPRLTILRVVHDAKTGELLYEMFVIVVCYGGFSTSSMTIHRNISMWSRAISPSQSIESGSADRGQTY